MLQYYLMHLWLGRAFWWVYHTVFLELQLQCSAPWMHSLCIREIYRSRAQQTLVFDSLGGALDHALEVRREASFCKGTGESRGAALWWAAKPTGRTTATCTRFCVYTLCLHEVPAEKSPASFTIQLNVICLRKYFMWFWTCSLVMARHKWFFLMKFV